jgi:3',5'-cyclic AMP phosphodiesterase CpdA
MNQPLTFRDDGSFTIVQFTDLHWHDGTGLDVCTASLMGLVLDAERPDLVVLTGDMLEGSQCPDPAAAWRQVVKPMEIRALPWAAVFGNHDDEGSLSRRELLAIQRSSRRCLSEAGPESIPGVGNYVLNIQSHDRPDSSAALYFLDSGSYSADGNGYAAISREQIGWFRSTLPQHAEDARQISLCPIPAVIFLHIPLPEFALAGQAGTFRGLNLEAVQCPRVNTDFFAAARSAGVLGIFAGHDHLNDFDADWHGVRLCFGRATGYRGYGREGFARGARVIRLIEGERSFETWLRLEDGTARGQV